MISYANDRSCCRCGGKGTQVWVATSGPEEGLCASCRNGQGTQASPMAALVAQLETLARALSVPPAVVSTNRAFLNELTARGLDTTEYHAALVRERDSLIAPFRAVIDSITRWYDLGDGR